MTNPNHAALDSFDKYVLANSVRTGQPVCVKGHSSHPRYSLTVTELPTVPDYVQATITILPDEAAHPLDAGTTTHCAISLPALEEELDFLTQQGYIIK